ncbi:hypothetical protein AAGW05_02965 [Arthrobacter sp. LAPM80]|uniref:hypothetical protein n=1 Tax=Arthrobacter sp. LAPM80 TaxID=3141788 RepID=UPI00398B9E4E
MPAQKNRKRLPPPEDSRAAQIFPVHRKSGSALAEYLMDPARAHAVVVVSFIPGAALRIDAAAVAAQVGAEAEVFEVANGVETHHLQHGLPEHLHVFGTGARVYPHGPQWAARTPNPHVPHHASQLPALYQTLENEVLAAEHFQSPRQTSTGPLAVVSEAVVKGFPSADRAMVELVPSGEQAVIRGEDLLAGIPLDWLVSKGQRLTGSIDPAGHVLDVKDLLLPRPSPVTVYKSGDVALARVKSVQPSHAVAILWPGSDFRIGVERISSNDLDSAEDLLTEGEVVRVRVLYENGAVLLSMLDVDDDEPAVPAPPLLRGGPPWLVFERPYASLFTAGTPAPAPAQGSPAATGAGREPGLSGVELARPEALLSAAERRTALQSTQMQLESARRTIAELLAEQKRRGATDKVARALQDQLEVEQHEAVKLARLHNAAVHQLDALKDELARAKASLVQLRQQRRSASNRTENAPETLFLDPAEQFNFDLTLAWARTVPAADKAAHPLGSYGSNQHFLESWAALNEQQRAKTLRAVVDLVAGRTGPLRKREPHVLRLKEGAHAGATLRGEDVCWRLYVEQGTAGALRLHYWKLASGGLELHEVVTHDVVKP